MKNINLLLLCLLLLNFSNAQDYNFTLNKEGKVEFSGIIESTSSSDQMHENLLVWLSTKNHNIVIDNKEEGKITTTGDIKSKSTYNPFAGVFEEFTIFILKLNSDNQNFNYVITDIKIKETYMGYGNNYRTTDIEEKIELLEEAKIKIKKAESDETLKRKQRKDIIEENNDIIENTTETLNKAYQVLSEFINDMQKQVNN